MKKISRIFISLLLVLSMSIITALSASASTTKNYSFYISNTWFGYKFKNKSYFPRAKRQLLHKCPSIIKNRNFFSTV